MKTVTQRISDPMNDDETEFGEICSGCGIDPCRCGGEGSPASDGSAPSDTPELDAIGLYPVTREERAFHALAAKLERERDEARAALRDLLSWFPEKASPPEWRIPAGKYGADDAVAEARGVLASPNPERSDRP